MQGTDRSSLLFCIRLAARLLFKYFLFSLYQPIFSVIDSPSQYQYMKIIFAIVFCLVFFTGQTQGLKNSSYKNHSGEKVLRIEMTLPVSIEKAWQLFTTDEKLKTWIAPLAHIELKSGGYIVTNYDSAKKLTDSTSIKLPLISFIDKELLVLKVILNNHFDKSVRDTDDNLQEIIQFRRIDDSHTVVISSMIGWGTGSEWDKAYNFFVRGNEWTYNELLKTYKQ
jgi:hypothetical protein